MAQRNRRPIFSGSLDGDQGDDRRNALLVVHNIGALLTGETQADDRLAVIPDAAVVAEDDKIAWVGPEDEMPRVPFGTRVLDARGCAVMPGLIDCHTHLLHVGDRSAEFEARALGQSYLDIARAGGGILATVAAVREASEEQLVDAAAPRLRRALARGVTTLEVKSGYGLDWRNERKMLQALRILAGVQPIEILPTFLGAHAIPPEFASDPDGYVDRLVHEIIPAIGDARMARFCDVYVEQSAFSVEQARRVLLAGQEAGLEPRLHTDQFTRMGGCALAAEIQALSADHLEVAGPEEIEALVRADVVAVILPTCEIYLGKGGPAPGRALADAGLRVAVASDFNPGSANCESLLIAATLAVTRCGLSVDEAILGVTRNAAAALGRDDIGQIVVGAQCDLIILDTAQARTTVTELGSSHVERVIKAGRLVFSRDAGVL